MSYQLLLEAIDDVWPQATAAEAVKHAAAVHLLSAPHRTAISSHVASYVAKTVGKVSSLGINLSFRQLMSSDPCFIVDAPTTSEAFITLNTQRLLQQQASRRQSPSAGARQHSLTSQQHHERQPQAFMTWQQRELQHHRHQEQQQAPPANSFGSFSLKPDTSRQPGSRSRGGHPSLEAPRIMLDTKPLLQYLGHAPQQQQQQQEQYQEQHAAHALPSTQPYPARAPPGRGSAEPTWQQDVDSFGVAAVTPRGPAGAAAGAHVLCLSPAAEEAVASLWAAAQALMPPPVA